MNTILSGDLAALMASDARYAVFDVRERGEYNDCHIAGATSLPRSQIEFRIRELVPQRNVPLVLYDEGGVRAPLAAATISELGYGDIAVLEGGLPVWRSQGGAVASGVNVPSKAFGEKVHKQRNVPDITPEMLKSWQEQDRDLILLDVRTPEEYARFCIPGAMNVPGGDLVLWAHALKQRPQTKIIVNCAGRTRSIIGTATLRALGLDNVYALKNGTMGWVLAGLDLESSPRREAALPPAESVKEAGVLAGRIAREESILGLTPAELQNLMHRNPGTETIYLIDVRSEKEYAAGHVAGSINVPGGQAVQRADDFVAVRNGRVVFISHEGARAAISAHWYRRMGYRDVAVLDGGVRAWVESGQGLVTGATPSEPLLFEEASKSVKFIAPAGLARRLNESSAIWVLDVGASLDYGKAHVPQARWISRGWLDVKFPELVTEQGRPIVVTCPDGRASALAARTLQGLGYTEVAVLAGGVGAWAAAGYRTESGLTDCLAEPDDVVLSPSITGNKDEMRRYLEWEVKLK